MSFVLCLSLGVMPLIWFIAQVRRQNAVQSEIMWTQQHHFSLLCWIILNFLLPMVMPKKKKSTTVGLAHLGRHHPTVCQLLLNMFSVKGHRGHFLSLQLCLIFMFMLLGWDYNLVIKPVNLEFFYFRQFKSQSSRTHLLLILSEILFQSNHLVKYGL